MNGALRSRFLDLDGAFDAPVPVLLGVIGGVLILAPSVTFVLSALGVVKPELRREIVRRYLTWLVIILVVGAPVIAGPGWTILLTLVLSLLCYREFARATGFFRDRVMSVVVVVGIIAITLASLDHWYGLFVALSPLTIVIILSVAIGADQPKGYIQRVGVATLGFLLFGVCLGHLGYLANDSSYRAILLMLLITIALNDIFAFAVGKSIGGPKLAPQTSPNKTASGSVGAIVLTTALFVVLGGMVFEEPPLSRWPVLLLLGMTLSVAGQLGDLVVSSIKRDLGIKDMGAVLPGHGGVLDRCNSLLLATPAMFHFVGYFRGIGLDQPIRMFTGG